MSIQLGSLIVVLPLVMPVTYWIMLGLVLLSALFVSSYQLYHRLAKSSIGKQRLLIGLNILAFVALAGLILEVKIATVKSKIATLITQGVTDTQLAAMPGLNGEDTLWYLVDPAVKQTAQADKQSKFKGLADSISHLDSVAQISQLSPDLQQLNIIGDGLTAMQWQQLFSSYPDWGNANASNLGISFSPSSKLSGPVNLNWQKQLVLGQPLTITGQLQAALPPTGKTELYSLALVDPAGELVEELELSPQQHFSFNVTPKTQGRWLYQLKLSALGTDSPVTIEPLAVSVSYPPSVSIAIWQSAPSFETRQLKSWAAHFGNRLTIVSQISRDKFISEQLNTAPLTIAPKQSNTLTTGLFFTAQQLATYDLLLIDGRGLVVLDKTEREQLAEAVTQGLGVLILADGDLLRADNGILSSLTEAVTMIPTGVPPVPGALYWHQTRHAPPLSWLPAELATTTGEVLVENETDQAIVVSAQQGLGQMAMSLINTSYTWQTGGHSQLYSQYWQYLILHLARNRSTPYWLAEPDNSVAFSGSAQQICAQNVLPKELAAGKNPLDATLSHYGDDGQPLPLMLQNSLLNDTRQCTYYWAMQPGWQRFVLRSAKDTKPTKVVEQARYVYPTTTWPAWQQSHKHLVSAQVAKRAVKAQPGLSDSTVPKEYFFLSLVLILTLLWVGRKRL